MMFQLSADDYSLPGEIPFLAGQERSEYLNAHRAGWVAFAEGIRTTLTEDGYQRGSLIGIASVRPVNGTAAALAGFDAGFAAANALHLQRVLKAQADHLPAETEWNSPIGQPDCVDIIIVSDDGTVVVKIVAARALDPQDQRIAACLEAKVRNYCRYIKHPAFAAEFGAPTPERVTLVLQCKAEIPEEYIRLFARVGKELRVPAKLQIRYE